MVSGAADLHARGEPNVAKCLTELAYELVRQQVRPAAVSRMTAVYSFCDRYEAFSFLSESSVAQQVYSGTIPAGVQWTVAPMELFRVVEPLTPDEAGYTAVWATAVIEARAYWDPTAPLGDHAEVLAPEVHLELPQLKLLDVMRHEGLLI